jgi:GMP synthase-like glutamine amidotransferase
MRTLLIDNSTKRLQELIATLPGELTVITKQELANQTLNDFDLVVLSGGSGNIPTVLHDPKFYSDEVNMLHSFNGAILGICLGCEIICEAFGGTLKEMPAHEHGEVAIQIIDPSLALHIEASSLTSFESHFIGIDKVPDGFIVCAESEHAPEIIRHKTRSIIGIQFHPEVEISKKLWKWILDTEMISPT